MESALCRLCTNAAESTEIPNLFARNHRQLLQRVKELTGILLKNVRSLPQVMCRQCEQDLEQAYSFRERCIKAQTYYTSAAYTQLLRTDPHNRAQLKTKRQGRTDKVLAADNEEPPLKKESVEPEEQKKAGRELNPSDAESETELDAEMVALTCEPDHYDSDVLGDYKDMSNKGKTFTAMLHGGEVEFSTPEKEQKQPDIVLSPETTAAGSPISTPTPTPTMASATVKKPAKHKSDKKQIEFKERKKRMREKRQTEFICDQCGNHFKAYNHFQMHLKRHTGEKTHQCEVCPDKFYTYSELTRHMRRHTGERPFACRHCQRRFTDYSTRIKHERTHTNERPFSCTHCDKAFTTSYILKNHMLVHTGERSFECRSCNKSFQRQTNLITHYRSIMHQQNVEKQKLYGALNQTQDPSAISN